MRWYDTVCQTNFSKWFCLVRGQNRSLLQRGGFQFRARLWKVTRFNFYQIYLRPGLIILFKGIRYVRNYRHKAGLCWAPSSLHLCNWLFLSPIRSHKVLVAKDQCAKWFHYIQKPFGKRKKKRERERSHGSVNGTYTHSQRNKQTYALDHTHTHTHTHTAVKSCTIISASNRKLTILIMLYRGHWSWYCGVNMSAPILYLKLS